MLVALPRFIRNMVALFALGAGLGAPAAPVWLDGQLHGVPIGTNVDVLEDPTGRLTLKDLTTRPWIEAFARSAEDNPNFGFRDSTLWIRIRLERGALPGPWMLEVAYPLLDNLEFYGPGITTPLLGGDHTRLSQRQFADRHFVFPVEAPELGVNVYYLKVRQSGTMSVPMRLWDKASFDRAKRDESFVLGAYYGLLAVMMAYNLFLYFVVRDRAYAAYVVYVGTMGFLVGTNNGFGALYAWPEAPSIGQWAQLSAAPLVCAAAAVFTRWFLHTQSHSRTLDRALLGIIVLGLAIPLVATSLPSGVVFWVDHALAVASITCIYTAGIVSYRSGFRPAAYYLIAFFAVCLGAAMMVVRNLGGPANLVTDYGLQIGSALEVVLLSMGLADRINTMRREKEQAQGEAIQSRDMVLKTLRETERELELRVAERTTALESLNRSLQAEVSERERTAALLQESEERMRYQAQHDPLTGLPNRWLLRDRLMQATARAKRDRTAFAVILVDLDNFKAVNDTLGHDVGDLLLVEVAQRLSGCIRERDTIARIGGDEFVFVLEGLAAPEDSALVARKIIEELSAPFGVAGEWLRTSPSIGISLYPEDGQDADFLLKFADIAMYRAKSAGRNCYRFYHDPPQLHAYDEKVE